MKIELISVGTELLLGTTIDTNTAYLGQQLADLGLDVHHKQVVGDNWLRMVQVLSQALDRGDMVITCGGLGPTLDDITREAVAAVLDAPLIEDAKALASMQDFFAQRGRVMKDNNRRQAGIPTGGTVVENPIGTAPGFILSRMGKTVVALPGIPREMQLMFENTVRPYLQQFSKEVLVSRYFHFAGIGESDLEVLLQPLMQAQTNPTLATYVAGGVVTLRVSAKSASRKTAEALVEPVEFEIRRLAGNWLFGIDQESLASVVGELLRQRKQTLAVAESCSGGLISHQLTNVPGSSDYFLSGFVVYSNQGKQSILAVAEEIIQMHGAVSNETAAAMANAARAKMGADWGVAVTGIAGPGGGSPEKPLGLVYMAVASKRHTKVERHQFAGERQQIKDRTATAALNLLRSSILLS